MCVLSFIFIIVAVCILCAVRCVIIIRFYLLFSNYSNFDFSFFFVCLFLYVFLYFVYSLLFVFNCPVPISVPVYRPPPPIGNPIALNKYPIIYFSSTKEQLICMYRLYIYMEGNNKFQFSFPLSLILCAEGHKF
jgi:hypothetical protein